jgi:hypothetical protein
MKIFTNHAALRNACCPCCEATAAALAGEPSVMFR